jgi:outer membrane protein OmpA-like peptidoglycan-associated protein
MTAFHKLLAIAGLAALLPLGAAGCASRTAKGAAIGAGAGAAAGALIGAAAGSTAKGAIIGAAVGGAGGAIIGRQMDQQAEELAKSLPNATVERVGEGILVTFESGILFDVDSATLRQPARQNLQNLADSLKKYSRTNVLLVGHTDSTGPDAYNQDLSERRASAASAFLSAQGVSRPRVETAGRGELEPVAANETAGGRQQNRRVEVAIFANEQYRDEAAKRG